MKLDIKVVPGSSRIAIRQENSKLKVYLTKPAQDGQANAQLIKVLAKHLGIKKYQLKISQGLDCRDKVIQIDDDASSCIKK